MDFILSLDPKDKSGKGQGSKRGKDDQGDKAAADDGGIPCLLKRERASPPRGSHPRELNFTIPSLHYAGTGHVSAGDPDASHFHALARQSFGKVVRYCTSPGCRRAFLLAHFGEKLAAGAGCSGCDYCTDPSVSAGGALCWVTDHLEQPR